MKRLSKIIFLNLFLFFLLIQALPGQVIHVPTQDKNTLMRRMASQLERLGQYDRAAQIYINLSLDNPRDVSYYLGVKRCLLALDDYDRLANVIRQLQSKRRDIRYEVDLAEIEYLRGEEKKAIQHWHTILEENSRSHEAYALIGRVMTDHRLYDEAIKVYNKARKVFKAKTLFVFEVANIHTLRSEFDQLTREYLNYLSKNPRQVTFIESRFIAIARNKENIDKLTGALKKNEKRYPAIQAQILQLLASLHTINRQYQDALNEILQYESQYSKKPTQKNKKDTRGFLLERFARAAEKDDAYQFARKAYTAIIEKFPDSPYAIRAQLGLARVLEAEQNYDQAIVAYEEFIQTHKKSVEALRAFLRIGDLYYSKLFELDKAEKVYNKILKNYPGTSFRADVFDRLGQCAIASGDLQKAEKIYHRLVSESKARYSEFTVTANLALAQIEFYRGNPSMALKYLQEIINKNQSGKSSSPHTSENDALELYMTISENRPDSVGLAMLGKAQHLLLQRKYDEIARNINDFFTQDSFTLVKDELRLVLIKAYRNLGKYDLAVQQCDSLVNNTEGYYRDLGLKLKADIFANDLKKMKKAQDSYESLLANFPESIYIEEARKQIRRLQKMN